MKKKLTIGYILDDNLDKNDGVQQAVLVIGEYMRSLGHDVHYIVADTERTDIKNIHSIGKYIALKFNGNSVRTPLPVSRKKIRKLFQEVDFDVLHVQMPHSPLLGSVVLSMAPAGVKKVGTFHILPYNVFSSVGTKALGLVMKFSLKKLDTAYAVSPPALEFMKSSFGIDGTVLPNPIDYEFYSGFKCVKKSKTQIVFVGRFDERKGVKQLVKAYAEINKEIRSNVVLTMCGKGPLLDEVKKMARDMNIDIDFPGFVSDVEKAQYLADADIAVFPSISGESFGIVLTEAMSAGAGVTLGGNNPGYASVLHSWPDVLFDPLDTAEFRNKLTEFIKSKPLRDELGYKQHEEVKDYDIKLVARRLLDEAYR